jgi:SAM-dependent methyltransferase
MAAAVEQAEVEAFAGRALGDIAGMMTTLFCVVGDRLGLFSALAEAGSASSEQLAARAGVDERYVREWLRGLSAAGYLEHDRANGTFSIPPAHLPVLAEEGGPMFFGGVYQETGGALPVVGKVADAFRSGGGVDQAEYGPDFWAGLERFTGGWFDHLLLPVWLPAMPRVAASLEAGAHVADVGCGAGRALVRLAEAYPKSRFVGFEIFDAQLDRARANAQAAGVGDRVRFEAIDASRGLPDRFDVITTFDVVHDAVDPIGLMRSIREGLADDGTYVLLEINSADDPADNMGPLAATFYGFSLFYCMTTSLAHNGAGLGTCGMPEATVRAFAADAGFGEVVRVPIDNPFNVLYELRR